MTASRYMQVSRKIPIAAAFGVELIIMEAAAQKSSIAFSSTRKLP